jgi:Txe/YoeB family toxin of Txe-Axe toxin-antitoxin module
MKLVFSSRAWEDNLHWQGDNRRGLDRVNALIKECLRDPFRGRQSVTLESATDVATGHQHRLLCK